MIGRQNFASFSFFNPDEGEERRKNHDESKQELTFLGLKRRALAFIVDVMKKRQVIGIDVTKCEELKKQRWEFSHL